MRAGKRKNRFSCKVGELTEVASSLSRQIPAESCGQRQSLNRQGTHLGRIMGSGKHHHTEDNSNIQGLLFADTRTYVRMYVSMRVQFAVHRLLVHFNSHCRLSVTCSSTLSACVHLSPLGCVPLGHVTQDRLMLAKSSSAHVRYVCTYKYRGGCRCVCTCVHTYVCKNCRMVTQDHTQTYI